VVSAWYCAGLRGDRGQTGQALGARVANEVGPDAVREFECVDDALRAALEDSANSDGVLVFGSFHTADEADRFMGG
jgi:dihydrofolate synthase/folylpolyglutamate synthase